MKRAISETNRRRKIQLRYNEENDITPESIVKPINMGLIEVAEGDYWTPPLEAEPIEFATQVERDTYVARLEKEMREAAKKFEFERAATLRDKIRTLKQSEVMA
jgi:excinuclease ABC subunit B